MALGSMDRHEERCRTATLNGSHLELALDEARRLEPVISRVLFPPAVTPGRATIISLGPPLPVGSSNLPAPRHLVGEPSGPLSRKAARGLFGLAPGGVYRAPLVTLGAVSSYLTVSPLPSV